MHKIVLKVAVELSATFLLGARIASIASFIEAFKVETIQDFLVKLGIKSLRHLSEIYFIY